MPQADPIPNTLGETVQRCQALMGDMQGRYITRAYCVPFINQAYSDIAKAIKLGSGKNFEGIVELLNVPTGTISLHPWQRYNFVDPGVQPPVNPPAVTRGPLAGLYDPLRLWVKTSGQLPQYYTPARGPRDTLPHVNPPGVTPGTYAVIVTFAWIGNQLTITPVAGPVDIQVYGRFNPPRLVKDEDALLIDPDMTDTLAYCACGLFGVEKANPTVLEGYATRGMAGVDNITASIILQTQKNPRRLATMGGRGGTCWGWS